MRNLLTRGATLLAVFTLVIAGAAPVTADGNRYVQISASGDHTCALTAQGKAYCWGRNENGELGNGDYGVIPGPDPSPKYSSAPVAVVGGLKFKSISAGESHTCALTARGRAYCWGSNQFGQIGAGDYGDVGFPSYAAKNSPVPVAVNGGLTFSSISAGDYFTCAITARGKAYCWGTNGYGQLGDGTTNSSDAKGPQAVIGGLTFASISAGDDHACALTKQGAAYCWGENDQGPGELGDGTTNSSEENGPQRVIGGLTFASLNVSRDAGSNFTCALTARGNAYCWGYNADGQLGDGTTNSSAENGPQAVIGGLRFASINPGEEHACALTTKGRAYCWGLNSYGRLGDGTVNSSNANGPQAVIGGLKFASIKGGGSHTCALTTRGKAYCWGRNNYGQLGNGTTNSSYGNGPQAVQ